MAGRIGGARPNLGNKNALSYQPSATSIGGGINYLQVIPGSAGNYFTLQLVSNDTNPSAYNTTANSYGIKFLAGTPIASNTIANPGNAGGNFYIYGGAGGINTYVGGTSLQGGAGGGANLYGGNGGALPNATTGAVAGQGGQVYLAAGNGGLANGTASGGSGGYVQIYAGYGGNNAANKGGAPASITLTPGSGATASHGSGGSIGLSSGAADNGGTTSGGVGYISLGAATVGPAQVLNIWSASGYYSTTGSTADGSINIVTGYQANGQGNSKLGGAQILLQTSGGGSAQTTASTITLLSLGNGNSASALDSSIYIQAGSNYYPNGGIGARGDIALTLGAGVGKNANAGGFRAGGSNGGNGANLTNGQSLGSFFSFTCGNGGNDTATTGTAIGGQGGPITLQSGAGGTATATSGTGTGGIAGAININGGAGGNGVTTGGSGAGVGLNGGNGGNAATGGTGGGAQLIAGPGGNGTTTNGAGGTVIVGSGYGGLGAGAAGSNGSILLQVGGNTIASFDPNGNFLHSKAECDQSFNYQTPTTGFSITIGNNISTVILDPAGTLATGTITMPAAPVNGQKVTVSSSQIITALTVNGNTGQTITNAPTSAAAGIGFTYIYRVTNTTWYRLH